VTASIAFIGLGVMGRPMVRNLLRAGNAVVVYDITPAPLREAATAGAIVADSPKDAAARGDVVITMLPDSPQVEQAVLGPGGVLEGARSGTIVIDMSSISPVVSQKVGAACEAHNIEFLDAPVSGGEPKAIDGTLAIMVGGKPEVFEKVEPILKQMGSTVVLTGPVGAGNVTKLANQIMVACNIAAMGEALVLASKAGLDPVVVFNAVKSGLAGSTVLNAKAPMVFSRNFTPGFRISLHQKDLRNAMLAAESLKVSLPFTGLVNSMLISLMNDGKGELDHSAIVQHLEQMSGTEVVRLEPETV
jgi:2-hydroxy-3-oxopropionate reductase